MNFNPNAYMGYPYNQNPYLQSPQQPIIPQVSTINGKIVENEEIVKVTEVPIGGYGVFPKADLTEIYVKTWNGNSKKMDTLTYKLSLNEAEQTVDIPTEILKKIDSLEQKLDSLFMAKSAVSSEQGAVAAQKGGTNNVF